MAIIDKKSREYQIWCPECGASIKKSLLICPNCKFKVRPTLDMNNKQKKDPEAFPEKNPLKKSGHPRYWNF